MALLRDWRKKEAPAYVIDLTRYDLKAVEPIDSTLDKPVKDWVLINKINQKGLRPQDQSRHLSELDQKDQELIKRYYPELF